MKQPLRAMALSIALTSLGGCGGGESGAFLFNAFVGFWVNSCEAGTLGGSEQVNIRLTELSETSLSGSFSVDTYSSDDCSGTPTSTVQFSVRQDGTRPVTGGTAIEVTLSSGTEILKDLLFVQDNQLFRGIPGPFDADGYPSLIDFAHPFRLN